MGLLVAGELLDRYHERWVVGIGAAVVAAGLLLGSLAQGYAPLLLVLLVVGAGYSTAQPGGSKSVAAWFHPAQRGLAMGVRQAGLPLGGAVAAAVLSTVATRYGWRTALVVGGVVALLGAGLFTALYRRPPIAVAALLFAWLGFFGIGWYGPWVAHPAESAPPGRTGFALGPVMAVNQLAVIRVPPSLGLLRDTAHSFAPAWAALAAATAVTLAVTARGDRTPRMKGSAV
ncbi:MFS transporter [Kitasatospora aureofaciens]|uniref:MFS transporter n=1 Tax=Kitasatospora aureofaciens TaxID=1894 RepID=UPI0036F46B9D